MAQFLRPSLDAFNAGWSRENGSSVNLFESINDVVQNDLDYIQSGMNPSNQVYVTKLNGVPDPGVNTGHIFRIAGGKSAEGGRKIDFLVEVRQGYVNESNPGVLCGGQNFVDIVAAVIGSPFPVYQAGMDPGIVANITDYTDVYLRLVVNTQP